jgi:hypothetical protein
MIMYLFVIPAINLSGINKCFLFPNITKLLFIPQHKISSWLATERRAVYIDQAAYKLHITSVTQTVAATAIF